MTGATARGPVDPSRTIDLASIQVLRALAALNVVMFHVIKTGGLKGYDAPFLTFLDGWGANGVDLFFVISGFIMFVMQERRHDTPGSFMANRIARIVPLYWSLTALFAAIGFLVPAVLYSHVVTAWWTLLSFTFLSQAAMGEQPILFLGWTLELEMLFYALFAISLVVRRRRLAPAFAGAAIVAAAVLLDRSILIEFVFGMAIGWTFRRARVPRAVALACVIVGFIGLGTTLLAPALLRIDRVITWGLPAALVLFGTVHLPQLHWRPATMLGDASYSIYLVQVFTIPVFLRGLSRIAVTHDWPILSALACIVCTAMAGWCLHAFYDVHVHRYAKQWLESRIAVRHAR